MLHDNLWPDESPIGYVPDEQVVPESVLLPTTDSKQNPSSFVAHESTDERKPKRKDKPDRPRGPVEFRLPPTYPGIPPTRLAPRFPIGALARQVLEWTISRFGAALGTLGLTVLLIFMPTSAGPENEWERTLPEEDENRYRELEAKRSEALAKGQKLPPQEEAEWQALEKRKFPYGDGGNRPSSDNKNSNADEAEMLARFPKLEKHYDKHVTKKAEWNPPLTREEYYGRAKELAQSPVGGDIEGFTSKEGYVFRYNKDTNEFLTMKPDGTIETLYKPERGYEYYLDQVEKHGK